MRRIRRWRGICDSGRWRHSRRKRGGRLDSLRQCNACFCKRDGRALNVHGLRGRAGSKPKHDQKENRSNFHHLPPDIETLKVLTINGNAVGVNISIQKAILVHRIRPLGSGNDTLPALIKFQKSDSRLAAATFYFSLLAFHVLFHRHTLCQVPRLVHIQAADGGDVIGQQLQRDDRDDGREHPRRFGHP